MSLSFTYDYVVVVVVVIIIINVIIIIIIIINVIIIIIIIFTVVVVCLIKLSLMCHCCRQRSLLCPSQRQEHGSSVARAVGFASRDEGSNPGFGPSGHLGFGQCHSPRSVSAWQHVKLSDASLHDSQRPMIYSLTKQAWGSPIRVGWAVKIIHQSMFAGSCSTSEMHQCNSN